MKKRKKLTLWIGLAILFFIGAPCTGFLYWAYEPIIEPHLGDCVAMQTSVGASYDNDSSQPVVTEFTLFHNGKKVRFFVAATCYTCMRWKENSEFVLVTKQGRLRVLISLKGPRVEPYFAIDPAAHKVVQRDGIDVLEEEWTPKN